MTLATNTNADQIVKWLQQACDSSDKIELDNIIHLPTGEAIGTNGHVMSVYTGDVELPSVETSALVITLMDKYIDKASSLQTVAEHHHVRFDDLPRVIVTGLMDAAIKLDGGTLVRPESLKQSIPDDVDRFNIEVLLDMHDHKLEHVVKLTFDEQRSAYIAPIPPQPHIAPSVRQSTLAMRYQRLSVFETTLSDRIYDMMDDPKNYGGNDKYDIDDHLGCISHDALVKIEPMIERAQRARAMMRAIRSQLEASPGWPQITPPKF